jgi:hypothetical protein
VKSREHEKRDIRSQPLHGAAGDQRTDELTAAHADGQQPETGHYVLGADDVVGVALAHR